MAIPQVRGDGERHPTHLVPAMEATESDALVLEVCACIDGSVLAVPAGDNGETTSCKEVPVGLRGICEPVSVVLGKGSIELENVVEIELALIDEPRKQSQQNIR